MNADIRNKIVSIINQVAVQQGISIPAVESQMAFVDDLGFSSMSVAALLANLEDALEVDPFVDDDVMITDIRTVDDLCNVYEKAIQDSVVA